MEKIARAALRFKGIADTVIVCSVAQPGRHGDVFKAMKGSDIEYTVGSEEQGFQTDTGRFVDREEGFHIATAAGQIKHKTGSNAPILYTEDMW